jgi:NADH-quinone oxidoreductase subunit G
MPKQLIVDGKPIEVEDGTTLLQACEQAGAEIPRFCYHERLSIAGNCRMCLVEVQGSPKPVASCAMSVNDLPPNKDGSPKVVSTTSPLVKKAREGVMEFLLINHPLDCPICDQGGECDLQDQSLYYGGGGSRYTENKRAVEEKHIGPLIKTVMTRCIHCTRCVRFMTEVAGVDELGLIGRGEDAEITTYLENGILSELSANAVDLCPVGALTHRPWAHNARPWELAHTESIDVMDAVGAAIRVDTRGRDVMRILPRRNDAVNEEWISDKTRHVADGLRTQRLDTPYVRGADGRLQPASWDAALAAVAQRLSASRPDRIGAIAGDLAGAEEMFALKDLLDRLGVRNRDCRADGSRLDAAYGRGSYLFNATIEGVERADCILIVGSNPRVEAAILNARILKRFKMGGLAVGVVGERVDLSYPAEHLGTGPETLTSLVSGAHPFAAKLRAAAHPLVIVGPAAHARLDGIAILSAAARIAEAASAGKEPGWQALNVLQTAASRVAGLDLGFVPGAGGLDTVSMIAASGNGTLDALYLLGADELPFDRLGRQTFVIYQGSHGDAGATRADVILPGAAYTEKAATYVNLEGRAQMTARAAVPPGLAKEDWTIVRALSGVLGKTLPYDDIRSLRQAMYTYAPQLARLGQPGSGLTSTELSRLAGHTGSLRPEPFSNPIRDFYLTNAIARSSAVMAEMSALKKARAGDGSVRQAAE